MLDFQIEPDGLRVESRVDRRCCRTWTTSRSPASWPRSATCSRSRARIRSRSARTATPRRSSPHPPRRLADLTAAERLRDPRHRQGPRREDRRARRDRRDPPTTRSCSQEFPPPILDLLRLQGVGPKTVALLYRELGIRTLDELEAAIARGPAARRQGHGREEGGADPAGASASAPRSPDGG